MAIRSVLLHVHRSSVVSKCETRWREMRKCLLIAYTIYMALYTMIPVGER
jgi:glycopeptide antibiotics resistance protein